MSGFHLQPLTLALGAAGIALNFAWPLLRGRKAMLAAQAVAGLFFLAHYWTIGAWTGGLVNGLAALQALAAVPLGERPGFRLVYLATLPAIALALAFSWQGWPSLCAALGMAGISLGRYQLRQMPFRVVLVSTIPFWTAHNLLVGSLPGLLSDLLVTSASLWAIRRLVIQRRVAGAQEAAA